MNKWSEKIVLKYTFQSEPKFDNIDDTYVDLQIRDRLEEIRYAIIKDNEIIGYVSFDAYSEK